MNVGVMLLLNITNDIFYLLFNWQCMYINYAHQLDSELVLHVFEVFDLINLGYHICFVNIYMRSSLSQFRLVIIQQFSRVFRMFFIYLYVYCFSLGVLCHNTHINHLVTNKPTTMTPGKTYRFIAQKMKKKTHRFVA